MLKSFDEGKVVYDGEASIDQLVKFIKSEALPLVNEFNEETAPKIFGGDINQHILLFIAKSDENYDAIQSGFATAAKVGSEFLIELIIFLIEDRNEWLVIGIHY